MEFFTRFVSAISEPLALPVLRKNGRPPATLAWAASLILREKCYCDFANDAILRDFGYDFDRMYD
jgi:hypothetical protein